MDRTLVVEWWELWLHNGYDAPSLIPSKWAATGHYPIDVFATKSAAKLKKIIAKNKHIKLVHVCRYKKESNGVQK